MNCKRTLFLLSFFVCLLAVGADYRQMPLEDKLSHPDLTFCVTFDQFSGKAEKAKGASDSTTLSTLNLGLRGTIGFDTQQGYQPVGDEELLYSVPGNISTESGTVTLWLNAPDYNPGAKDTDGKKRGNIAIFEFLAKNEKETLDFKLYEFEDTLYFGIFAGEHAKQVAARRNTIKKNQWHQVAITWDKDKIAIYLNGEFCEDLSLNSYTIPVVQERMKKIAIDPKLSYFGIPLSVWGEKRKHTLQVDDMKIYSRALSKLEIQKQYRELALDLQTSKIDLFEMTLNGVGNAPDTLEVDLDFSALPEKYATVLKQGKLKVSYTLTGPEGYIKEGTWNFTGTTESKRISGIEKSGTYTLNCNILDNDKKSDTVSVKIYRPDLSFIGNKIGYSNKVPAPWIPLVMKNRTVNIWNRVYTFDKGPFPENIMAAGKNLLLKTPELKISLPSGPVKITYSAEKTTFTEREATLTGRGVFDKYYFDYTTLVTYDGMIKTNFIMHGSPEISSMTLEWQVNPESAQYLMTPLLNEDKSDEFAAPYPKNEYTPYQLWFTSEKNGGFAYAMENDANWYYPEEYPVFMANKKTGECKVTMISNKVKLPETTDYQALFIATPTRPLVDLRRLVRFGGRGINLPYKYEPDIPVCGNGRPLLSGDGIGLSEGIGSFKPLPGLFEKEVNEFAPRAFGVYGMANAFTDASPFAKFFAKYNEAPGEYVYKLPYYKYNKEKFTKNIGNYEQLTSFSISACNAVTSVNDYILHNIQEIIDNPCGGKLWMVYYDLCGNTLCGNKLHGCGFTDKLGREIKTFTFMKKRNLIERSVQLTHDNGKVVLTHAQRHFNPFMHGLADYWYPGEQNNGLVMKNLNCYTDDIPDAIWRSEYNGNVLGTSVILCDPNPASFDKSQVEKITEGMISQALLHDIEFCAGLLPGPTTTKVWYILEKYGVDSNTPFHRYYEQNKVPSSNPSVRISYYELPKNEYLFILANKTAQDAETEVDVSTLQIPDGSVMREEFKGSDISVNNGKIKITIPSRTFRILGYASKKLYHYANNCSILPYSWKPADAKVTFSLDKATGHGDSTSCRIDIDKDNKTDGGCYALNVPAIIAKTYTLSVWAKGANLNENSKICLLMTGQDDKKTIGTIASTEKPLELEWQKYVFSVTVSAVAPWDKTTKLQVVLGYKNLNGGTIWFDDIEIDEVN